VLPSHRSILDLGPDNSARWRASELGTITEGLERRLILELAGDVAGRRILDVGCGDGEFAIELGKRGAKVMGIDASADMIVAARARTKLQNADVAFQVAEAEHLPFSTGQFDLVTAITIVCFVDDAAPVFQEIARVLRPGGRLIVGELSHLAGGGGSRRRDCPRGDLLSAVEPRRTRHEPGRPDLGPAYHGRRRLSRAFRREARRRPVTLDLQDAARARSDGEAAQRSWTFLRQPP
jgi:SAM-dependent methyltransferase